MPLSIREIRDAFSIDLKSCVLTDMWVRPPPRAQMQFWCVFTTLLELVLSKKKPKIIMVLVIFC